MCHETVADRPRETRRQAFLMSWLAVEMDTAVQEQIRRSLDM